MIQVLNIMYISIHLCDDQYLLAVTYIIMCNGFVFWAWRLSTERVVAQPVRLYLLPPGVKVLATIGWLLLCTLLYDLMRLYIYVFEV